MIQPKKGTTNLFRDTKLDIDTIKKASESLFGKLAAPVNPETGLSDAEIQQNTPKSFGKLNDNVYRDINLKDEYGDYVNYENIHLTDNGLIALDELKANNQSGLEQLWRGLVKGTTTFGVAVTDTFIGTIAGILNGVYQGFKTEDEGFIHGFIHGFVNNPVGVALDDAKMWVKEQLPNYYTQAQQDADLLSLTNLGSMNFWADKVFDGAAYSLAAAATLMTTGGSGLVGTAGRAFGLSRKIASMTAKELAQGARMAEIASNISKGGNIAKVLKAANYADATIMSALAESNVEARETFKSMKDSLIQDAIAKYGSEENIPDDIKQSIIDRSIAASNVNFGINMAVTGGTNMLMFGKMIMPKYNSVTNISGSSKNIFSSGFVGGGPLGKATIQQGVVAKALSQTKVGKALVNTNYASGLRSVITNAGEETFQELAQYGSNILTQKMFAEEASGNLTMAMLNETWKELGSKEGLESALIGAIVGGGMKTISLGKNAIRSKSENRTRREQQANLVALLNSTSAIANQFMLPVSQVQKIVKDGITSIANNTQLASSIAEVTNANSEAEYMLAQQKVLTDYTLSVIDAGGYDAFIDSLKVMKNASVDDISQMFGLPTEILSDNPSQRVEEIINSVESIEKAALKINNILDIQRGNRIKQIKKENPTANRNTIEAMYDAERLMINQHRGALLANMSIVENTPKLQKALHDEFQAIYKDVDNEVYNIYAAGGKKGRRKLGKIAEIDTRILKLENELKELKAEEATALNSFDITTTREQDNQRESKIKERYNKKRKNIQNRISGLKKSSVERVKEYLKIVSEYPIISKDNVVSKEEDIAQFHNEIEKIKKINPVLGEAMERNFANFNVLTQAQKEAVDIYNAIGYNVEALANNQELQKKTEAVRNLITDQKDAEEEDVKELEEAKKENRSDAQKVIDQLNFMNQNVNQNDTNNQSINGNTQLQQGENNISDDNQIDVKQENERRSAEQSINQTGEQTSKTGKIAVEVVSKVENEGKRANKLLRGNTGDKTRIGESYNRLKEALNEFDNLSDIQKESITNRDLTVINGAKTLLDQLQEKYNQLELIPSRNGLIDFSVQNALTKIITKFHSENYNKHKQSIFNRNTTTGLTFTVGENPAYNGGKPYLPAGRYADPSIKLVADPYTVFVQYNGDTIGAITNPNRFVIVDSSNNIIRKLNPNIDLTLTASLSPAFTLIDGKPNVAMKEFIDVWNSMQPIYSMVNESNNKTDVTSLIEAVLTPTFSIIDNNVNKQSVLNDSSVLKDDDGNIRIIQLDNSGNVQNVQIIDSTGNTVSQNTIEKQEAIEKANSFVQKQLSLISDSQKQSFIHNNSRYNTFVKHGNTIRVTGLSYPSLTESEENEILTAIKSLAQEVKIGETVLKTGKNKITVTPAFQEKLRELGETVFFTTTKGWSYKIDASNEDGTLAIGFYNKQTGNNKKIYITAEEFSTVNSLSDLTSLIKSKVGDTFKLYDIKKDSKDNLGKLLVDIELSGTMHINPSQKALDKYNKVSFSQEDSKTTISPDEQLSFMLANANNTQQTSSPLPSTTEEQVINDDLFGDIPDPSKGQPVETNDTTRIDFSIAESDQQTGDNSITLNEAKSIIQNILPDTFTVEEGEKILQNLVDSGIPLGALQDHTIFINIKKAKRSTPYHEAFHAVFRHFTTSEERSRLYRAVRRQWWNKLTQDQKVKKLDAISSRSSAYQALSSKQLEELTLEEYLAEQFERYSQQNKPVAQSIIKKIFDKIIQFFEFITGSADNYVLNSMYNAILKGEYKNRSEILNVSPTYHLPAFALVKRIDVGMNGNKTVSYFNNTTMQRIINTIAVNVSNKISNLSKDEIEDLENIDIATFYIGEELTNILETVYNWNTIRKQLEGLYQQNKISRSKVLAIKSEVSAIHNSFAENTVDQSIRDYNINQIRESVLQALSLYNISNPFSEEAITREQEENEKGEGSNWNNDITNVGGWESLSKFMRQYLGMITKGIDVFNIGIEYQMTIDGFQTHQYLEKLLTDTEPNTFLKKLNIVRESNSTVNALYMQLMKDIFGDPHYDIIANEKGYLDIASKSAIYNAFVSQYNKVSTNMLTTLTDVTTGEVNVFESNQRNAKNTQFDRWAKSFETIQETTSREEVIKIFIQVKNKLNSTASLFVKNEGGSYQFKDENSVLYINKTAKEIKELLEQAGIELSESYIKYSIIAKYGVDVFRDIRDSLSVNSSEYAILHNFVNTLESFTEVHGLNHVISNEDKEGSGAKQLTYIDFIIDILNIKSDNIQDSNPFVNSALTNTMDNGAIGILKKIAEGNAKFDETIVETTYQNAERKTVYGFIAPNYFMTEIRKLQDSNGRRLVRAMKSLDNGKMSIEEAKEIVRSIFNDMSDYDFNHFFNYIQNNPLLRNQQLLTGKFVLHVIDGIRQTSLVKDNDGATQEQYFKADRDGKSYGKLDTRGKIIQMLSLYQHSRGDYKDTAHYIVGVNESANTNFTIALPKSQFVNNELSITDAAMDELKTLFVAEFDKINRLKNEVYNEETSREITISNYHDGNKRALQLFNFRSFFSNPNEIEASALDNTFDDLNKEKQDAILNELKISLDEQYQEFKTLLASPSVKLIKQGGTVELLPSEFREVGNKLNEQALKNFFINDYIYTSQFNQIMDGDDSIAYKNPIDKVKRNKGKIASGADFGYGYSKGAIISIPTHVYEQDSVLFGQEPVDHTDAQSWSNISWNIQFLMSQGRYDNTVKKIYQKIRKGYDLSVSELNYLKDNKAMLQPLKTVYRDRVHYFKLSQAVLLRKETSVLAEYVEQSDIDEIYDKIFELEEQGLSTRKAYSVLHDLYKPIPGREVLHDMLNEQELKGIDYHITTSASKMASKNVTSPYNEQGNYVGFNSSPLPYTNRHWRLQVVTDGLKTKIVHGTQLMQLITSEQTNAIARVLAGVYNNKLGKRVKDGYNKVVDQIIDQEGMPVYDKLLESFQKSLINSNADPYLLTIFKKDEATGKAFINMNIGSAESKYQAMFLSFVSSQSTKNKVAGSKLTLKSDFGYNVLRDSNDNPVTLAEYKHNPSKVVSTSRLKHRIYDQKKDIYYSEVLVSAEVARVYNLKKGQTLTSDQAFAFGVRIPTQDNHSMVTIKIVDVLPAETGNVVILPKEIITLSGADFDIDSLFTHFKALYNGKDGYGSYYTSNKPVETAYKEQLAYIYTEDETFNETYTKNKKNSAELITIQKEIAKIQRVLNNAIEQKALQEGIEEIEQDIQKLVEAISSSSTTEEQEVVDEYIAELNNLELLLPELKAYTSYDTLKELNKQYTQILDTIKKQTLLEINSDVQSLEFFSNKYETQINRNVEAFKNPSDWNKIKELNGKELDNLLLEIQFKLLHNEENKQISETPASFKQIDAAIKYLRDEFGIENTVSTKGTNSALDKIFSSSAIDIGKDGIGPVALFNIMYQRMAEANITLPVVGKVANYIDVNGNRINDTISSILSAMTDNAKHLFSKQLNLSTETLGPALFMLVNGTSFNQVAALLQTDIVKTLSEDAIGKKTSIKTAKEEYDKKLTTSTYISQYDNILNTGNIKRAEVSPYESAVWLLKNRNEELSEEEDLVTKIAHEKNVGLFYEELSNLSSSFINFTRVLSLAKGFSTTFDDIIVVEKSLNAMGLTVNVVESNDSLTISTDGTELSKAVETLINSSNLIKENVKAMHKLLNRDSSKFFILQDPNIKNTIDALQSHIKQSYFNYSDNVKKIRRSMLQYITSSLERGMSNKAPFNVDEMLFTDKIHQLYKNVLKIPAFNRNELLLFLQPKEVHIKSESSPYKGRILYKFDGATRTKMNPEYQERLANAYMLLATAINPETNEVYPEARELAGALYHLLIVKDSLSFTNNTYIKQIHPHVLKKVSSYLDTLQDTLNTTVFNDVSRMLFKKDPDIFKKEFIEIFLRYVENEDALPYIKDTPVDANNIGNIKGYNKANVITKDNTQGTFSINIAAGTSSILSRIASAPNNEIRKEADKDYVKAIQINIASITQNKINIPLTDVQGKTFIKAPLYIKVGKASYYKLVGGIVYDRKYDKYVPATENDIYGSERPFQSVEYQIVTNFKIGHKEEVPYYRTLSEHEASYSKKEVKTVQQSQNAVQEDSSEIDSQVAFMLKNSVPSKDQRVSSTVNNTITKQETIQILDKLSDKFGIEYIFDESLPVLGRYKDGKVIINPNLMKADTAWHEFAHPLVDAIKRSGNSRNKRLYSNLVQEIHNTERGQSVLKQVQNRYNDLSNEEQIEEAIVQLIGETAASINDGKPASTRLESLLYALWKRIKGLFASTFDINEDTLDNNASAIQAVTELLTNDQFIRLSDSITHSEVKKNIQNEVYELLKKLQIC